LPVPRGHPVAREGGHRSRIEQTPNSFTLFVVVVVFSLSKEQVMVNLHIFRHAETLDLSAGETVFKQGDTGMAMYVVAEGEVEILSGPVVLETARPGSVIGEMALIDHAPRSATAVAKTDCKLVAIDQRRFEFLVQQTPYFALEVMQLMAERLRTANRRIAAA
jgi:CRP/FNR family cyclic AMP-dependent transcriptional regulator